MKLSRVLQPFCRKIILIGELNFIEEMAGRLLEKGELVVGFYLVDAQHSQPLSRSHPNIERIFDAEDMQSFYAHYAFTDIVISAEFLPKSRQENLLKMVEHLPVYVHYCFPNFWKQEGGITFQQPWLEIPRISLSYQPISRVGLCIKRLMDIVLSLFFIFALSTLMIGIALLVKITSRGPAFFRQWRGGLGKAPLYMIKFRTLNRIDDGQKPLQQVKSDDRRLTPLGRILRRYGLDELPQLFNVLMGEMSLVGPRPHALCHDEEYAQLINTYAIRHRIKPGITGWAQIHGLRGETKTVEDMAARVHYDLEYMKNWSLGLDFYILFKTPIALAQQCWLSRIKRKSTPKGMLIKEG